MKKNISINIGGIIFHIEEDGYDKLKNYLDSVNKYFSSFEDSKEIISDIENRIAEIFLTKLDDGKQIITPEDVNDLIATMGTTKDFEASIETEPKAEAEKAEEKIKEEVPKEEDSKDKSSESQGKKQEAYEKTKRLYRDNKRRIVGGVASGLAHFIGIDPIWIRLIMLIFLFNPLFFSLEGLSLFVFLSYVILWIVTPLHKNLEEDKSIKKLYRSQDDKVIGGVASGLASYFGVDVVVIRVLFVVSIFFVVGFILYIILWIITPEARSITEKMQMQGEPVTLSNIENNVKQSLNVKEGEEGVFTKILLFPFRLIALVFKAMGEFLGPFLKFAVEALRIAFGIYLVLLGFVLMVLFTISLAVLLGVGGAMESWLYFGDFPAEELFNSMSTVAIVSAYLVSMVPSLGILLTGLVVILKKKVTSSFVAWSLFGLWLIGLIGLAISVPSMIRDFSVEGTFKEERTFAVNEGVTKLKLNELDWDAYNSVDLKIRGHEDSTNFLLEMEFDSRGYSRTNAKENGQAVDYVVSQEGNFIYFDSEIIFDDAPFRFQEVSATFYIPYGQVFTMDYDLRKILKNTLWIHGYDAGDLGDNEWTFDKSGLQCLSCDEDSKQYYNRGSYESDSQSYQFKDFDEVRLISLFDFEIVKGNDYIVRLEGDDDELDDVYLEQNDDELEIRYGKNSDWWKNRKRRDKIRLFIEMPELEYLKVTGACEGEVRNFNSSDVTLDIEGASKVWADMDTKFLEVDLIGASELTLIGNGEDLKVDLSGASELDAFNYIVDEADVRVNGASTAKVNVKRELEADASGASKVRYRGDARVSANSNGLSSVKRD